MPITTHARHVLSMRFVCVDGRLLLIELCVCKLVSHTQDGEREEAIAPPNRSESLAIDSLWAIIFRASYGHV